MARSVVACTRLSTLNLNRRVPSLAKADKTFSHSRIVYQRAFATSEGTVPTSSLEGKNKDANKDVSSPSATSSGDGKDNADKKETSSGWGSIVSYIVGAFSGLYFFYHFYKAGYNLHKTEISLLASFRRLPLYYPPSDSDAEGNSALDGGGLSPEIVMAFAEWFVTTDLQQLEGVTRDDVLELFRELGFDDSSKPCKRYLEKGDGMLEERRRLSGAALQESLSLLAELAFAPIAKVEEGEEPPVNPRELVGSAAVEVMRKKVKGGTSMSSNAAALMQAMKPPDAMIAPPSVTGMASAMPSQSSASETNQPVIAERKVETTMKDSSVDENVDDLQQLELERIRLQRLEQTLLARLERQGSLSAAEEGRLRDVRDQIAALPAN